MAISLEQVKEIFPEHLCLEIGKLELQKAKSVAANYADPVVSDRVFLNSLCLDIILPTIIDIFDVKQNYVDSKKIKQQHEKVWQSLDGVAIDLPQTPSQVRLVLIPTEDFDTEELRVKQEWLNNPDLVGDIYLAVQVSLEESWLRVWGFTSHQELHKQGDYDISDGSYAIDRSDLWFNLETMPAIWNLVKPKPNILSQLDFSSLWQPFDEFVADWNWRPAMELRQSRFQRHWARKIDQIITLQDHPCALMIGFQEEADHKYLIQVRISSGNEQIYLPDNLELIVLEANGEVIDTSTSRKADNWIQVEFTGEANDEFQVKVQRAGASIIEEFVI